MEAYAELLEEIIEKHAGMKREVCGRSGEVCEVCTDQTRAFIMKWAAYGSKMLTEVIIQSI